MRTAVCELDWTAFALLYGTRHYLLVVLRAIGSSHNVGRVRSVVDLLLRRVSLLDVPRLIRIPSRFIAVASLREGLLWVQVGRLLSPTDVPGSLALEGRVLRPPFAVA